jgi:hypothetical protein
MSSYGTPSLLGVPADVRRYMAGSLDKEAIGRLRSTSKGMAASTAARLRQLCEAPISRKEWTSYLTQTREDASEREGEPIGKVAVREWDAGEKAYQLVEGEVVNGNVVIVTPFESSEGRRRLAAESDVAELLSTADEGRDLEEARVEVYELPSDEIGADSLDEYLDSVSDGTLSLPLPFDARTMQRVLLRRRSCWSPSSSVAKRVKDLVVGQLSTFLGQLVEGATPAVVGSLLDHWDTPEGEEELEKLPLLEREGLTRSEDIIASYGSLVDLRRFAALVIADSAVYGQPAKVDEDEEDDDPLGWRQLLEEAQREEEAQSGEEAEEESEDATASDTESEEGEEGEARVPTVEGNVQEEVFEILDTIVKRYWSKPSYEAELAAEAERLRKAAELRERQDRLAEERATKKQGKNARRRSARRNAP